MSHKNLKFKNKNRKNEFEFYTHRETEKSESSWVPALSRFENYEEGECGNILN